MFLYTLPIKLGPFVVLTVFPARRLGDQEMFLAINFDGKIILLRTLKQSGPE